MLKILIFAFAFAFVKIMKASWYSVCQKEKASMPVSSSFTHRATNSSMATPKILAEQLGY